MNPKRDEYYLLQFTRGEQTCSAWNHHGVCGFMGRVKKNGGTPLQFENTEKGSNSYHIKFLDTTSNEPRYIKNDSAWGLVGSGTKENAVSFAIEGNKLKRTDTNEYVKDQPGNYGLRADSNEENATSFTIKKATTLNFSEIGSDEDPPIGPANPIRVTASYDDKSKKWTFECQGEPADSDVFYGIIKDGKKLKGKHPPVSVEIKVEPIVLKTTLTKGAHSVEFMYEFPCDIYINNIIVKENATRGEICGPYLIDICRHEAYPESEPDHISIKVVPRDLFPDVNWKDLPPPSVGLGLSRTVREDGLIGSSSSSLPGVGDPTLILKRKLS